MKRDLLFEDGSMVEVTIEIAVKGQMATVALQRLLEFVDEELPHDPEITLETESEVLDLDEENLEDEDIEELDEEWDEDLDEDWEEDEGEEDLEDYDEDWDDDEDL
jgi:hypothetical protein